MFILDRCFSGDGGKLVMFVTKTCPEALEGCVNNWLLASEGKCDGTDSPKAKETEDDAKPAPKTPKTRAPPGPQKPSSSTPPPPPVAPVPPGVGADPTISLPPQSASPPAGLPNTQQIGPGPAFTVPPPSTAPLIPSQLPDGNLPPGGGDPLGPQLPEDLPLPGPGGVPIPSGGPQNINPNSPQIPLGGDINLPPGPGQRGPQLPEDLPLPGPGGVPAPSGGPQNIDPNSPQIPPGGNINLPLGGDINLPPGGPPIAPGAGSPPIGLPENEDTGEFSLDGPGASIQNPAGNMDKELAIDLCFRVYSTTHLVDRTTCTGFGSSYEDPIRCIEDGQAFNPDTGIAYTPCADLRARLGPGDTKALFNMTIGDRPGRISARLSKSVDEPRPVCIFVEVEGDGEFPEEDEAGCMHPWEPVSMFIGKTCRTKTACSYHSLMVAGGGCLAPRTLPEDELEDLPEREGDLVAGFGEIGSEERYETPEGLVSQWIRCPAQPGGGGGEDEAEATSRSSAEAPEVEVEFDDSEEEEEEEEEAEEETVEPPTITSKTPAKPNRKSKLAAAPPTSRSPVKPKTAETVEEPESPPAVVLESTAPIITSRSNVPKTKKGEEEEEEDD